MFIATTKSPSTGRISVYLKEGYRDQNGKVKHRNLKLYGFLDELEAQDPTISQTLRDEAKQKTKKDVNFLTLGIDLRQTTQTKTRKNYGYIFLESIYNKLNIPSFIKAYSESKDFKYDLIISRLKSRGVDIEDIAKITLELQSQYLKDLTLETCLEHVRRVLVKREIQHAVFTGIELDISAEQGKLSEPLSTFLMEDYGLYGIDEILALSIVNVYGSIGLTNFGYVDKIKPGIMKKLDSKDGSNKQKCHTFLDDIVGAIAAAAASSVAHKYADSETVMEAYGNPE